MLYEYKVIAPPRRARRFKDLEKGETAFHRTIAETLTSLGLEGWSFAGVERMAQVRRRWLFWAREDAVEVMVFRREVRAILRADQTGDTAQPPITAVRVRRVTRPDAIARVADGERRISVRRPDIAAE